MSKVVTRLAQTELFAPLVRSGADGGCLACGHKVADHVDQRGAWLGCPAVGAPNVPLVLVPAQGLGAMAGNGANPAQAQPRKEIRGKVVVSPAGKENVAPRAAKAVDAGKAGVHPTGPQVAYIARYTVDNPAVQRLPNHDRKVYGLIARFKTNGATRKTLLEALKALKHTGRVDGAVRRLRLRHVITVKPLAA